jgi:NADH-quinone oxidoreductase subunit G
VLGNLLELDGFDQASSEQIRDALRQQLGTTSVDNTQCGETVDYSYSGTGLQRVGDLPIYAVDAVVRRAEALQKTTDADVNCVRLNPADAKRLGLADGDRATLSQGGRHVDLPVVIDERIAEGAAWAAQASPATLELAAPYDAVQVKKV